MRCRAFISHSHDGARWAAWLHRTLESYGVPLGGTTRDRTIINRK